MNASQRRHATAVDPHEYANANPGEVTLVADAHGDVDVVELPQDYRVSPLLPPSESTDDAGFLAIMAVIRRTPERQRELMARRKEIIATRRQQDC